MFCPACGTDNPATSRFCNSCGGPLVAAAPAGAAMPAPSRTGPALGGVVARALATVLDTIVLVAASVAALAWAAPRWGTVTPSGMQLLGLPALIFFAAAAAAAFAYLFLFEAVFGATLGKFLVNLQVRSLSGERAGVGAAFLRNLLRIIDGLFFYLVALIVALLSKQRQRVGDHVAGTIVVARPWNAGVRALILILWVAALGGAGWSAYTSHRTALTPTEAATSPAPEGPAAEGATPVSQPGTATPTGTVPPSSGSVTGGHLTLEYSFLESKGGPVRTAAPYKPGDDVVARYSITGYAKDGDRIDVQLNVVPVDPSGVAMDEPWTQTLRQNVGENVPINGSYKFTLPDFSPAGTYLVAIKVQDAVKQAEVSFEPSFLVVREAPVAPASGLEVRNFQYLAERNGPPLSPPTFERGRTVYWGFDLGGMQFTDHRPNVTVALKLLSPGGDVVLDQPDWITFRDPMGYHPSTFFLPLTGRVTLPRSTQPGAYTQQFTITDHVANATIEHQESFEVK